MTRLRKRGEDIRHFILEHIENKSNDIVSITTEHFNISRQAVHKHIRKLEEQGTILHPQKGVYKLQSEQTWSLTVSLDSKPAEDVIWRDLVREKIGALPDNVIDIWQYGFTEMFNNAIDHSQGKTVNLSIQKTAFSTEMFITDEGVGIFKKIMDAMDLVDERHAVLELTKGKLTTDPANHTGEGIFFTSRMFDLFCILSGDVFLSHNYSDDEDWILQNRERRAGTFIVMKLKNNTSRKTTDVFNKFSDDNYGFTKTIVPVRLAQYGNEKLVSRSQAKRLLDRIDRFKTVIFDFKEVETIGQAFADEVFRVFRKQHLNIEVVAINTNDVVTQMINRCVFR